MLTMLLSEINVSYKSLSKEIMLLLLICKIGEKKLSSLARGKVLIILVNYKLCMLNNY